MIEDVHEHIKTRRKSESQVLDCLKGYLSFDRLTLSEASLARSTSLVVISSKSLGVTGVSERLCFFISARISLWEYSRQILRQVSVRRSLGTVMYSRSSKKSNLVNRDVSFRLVCQLISVGVSGIGSRRNVY